MSAPEDRIEARDGLLGDLELFAGLDEDARAALTRQFDARELRRGEVLIREGDPADALYVLISGRLIVTRADRTSPLNEIGPGQAVGEIAFLAGGTRTATVTALRDSIVMRLGRADFDRLAANVPSIWQNLTVTLSRRLARTSAGPAPVSDPRPRTIAIVPAGRAPLDRRFVDQLLRELAKVVPAAALDSENAASILPSGVAIDSAAATEALNALERTHAIVVYVADDTDSAWSRRCARQADLVLAVARHGDDAALNPVESAAYDLVSEDQRRLVLLHPSQRVVRGTSRWLDRRKVGMHHHVALDDPSDIARLCRFITGTARGLVASGGGAYCAAHIGAYQALRDAGITFDIMGGTSGGSAMAAAFLMGRDSETIAHAVNEMFVVDRAMKRYTWPRYGLIDHTYYDERLRQQCDDLDVEDLWLPFFSVSTNLSRYALEVHRQGPLWLAVRASSAIPVLLPPYYSATGEMLVDGCLLDNVPVETMHALKSGPNVVVSFEPTDYRTFDVKYDDLPSRMGFARAKLTRAPLPEAPSIGEVLLRSLMASRTDYERHIGERDLLLMPPLPPGASPLDWHRHREFMALAFEYCASALELAKEKRHAVFGTGAAS